MVVLMPGPSCRLNLWISVTNGMRIRVPSIMAVRRGNRLSKRSIFPAQLPARAGDMPNGILLFPAFAPASGTRGRSPQGQHSKKRHVTNNDIPPLTTNDIFSVYVDDSLSNHHG